MSLARKRWQHFAAILLIGDGVMALVHPQRDAEAWHIGPEPWMKLMRELHKRPNLTRVIGAAQIVAAVSWAITQERSSSFEPNPEISSPS
jgi:hypothetical protein